MKRKKFQWFEGKKLHYEIRKNGRKGMNELVCGKLQVRSKNGTQFQWKARIPNKIKQSKNLTHESSKALQNFSTNIRIKSDGSCCCWCWCRFLHSFFRHRPKLIVFPTCFYLRGVSSKIERKFNRIHSSRIEWKFRENQLTKLSSFKSRGLTLNVKWHSSMLQLDCGFPSIKCISIRSAHFIQMRTSTVVNLNKCCRHL